MTVGVVGLGLIGGSIAKAIKYNTDKVDAANRKVIDYVLGKENRPG